MRFTILRTCVTLACSLLCAAPSFGQPDIPDALEPWRDWVLYGEEYRACPVLNGSVPGQQSNHICAWPGTLSIDVANTGATFELSWTVFAETWVTLPGSAQFWPNAVTVNGNGAAVVDRGQPSIRLQPGEYSITGSLTWNTRPANLQVPPSIGLVRLVLDGETITHPDLERGTLWLGLREGDEQEEDRLDIRVYRRLTDAIPIGLDTVIELDVAGQGREQSLSGALPSGFVGERLLSQLPTQLAADGTLRVQLRPGTWNLRLIAHAQTPVDTLQLAAQPAPWPTEEIWSYASSSNLRVTALEGLPGIDGSQAGVPNGWLELPAYQVTPGQTMTIVERSRNDASEPNRLQLSRDLWLDFDGDAFTALDNVSGSMGNGWRLDMAAPWVMTMAEASGDNLLVTEGPAAGLQGVELRATLPQLRATARLPGDTNLAVTGYTETFDQVDMTLHLPPAWRLLAAPGADSAGGAWIERWRLLDIFVVLIITVAAWRLFGPVGGGLALATLIMIYHEPWAPRWVWLNVLLAIALARVVPAGRFRSFATRYQTASLALVALLLIPFLIFQLRVVVYPQFERPLLSTSSSAGFARSVSLPEVAADRARDGVTAALPMPAPGAARLEEIVVTGSQIARAPLTRFAPGALVQTGPGLPDWSWNVYRLSWSGPIEPEQTWRMLLLSPWVLQIWRVLGAALAIGFFALLVRPHIRLPKQLLRGGTGAALMLALIAATPEPAGAQTPSGFPSPAILDQLRERLTEPEPCHPRCAETTSAALVVDADSLRVSLRVATQDDVAVPLPLASEGWRAESVRIDGAAVGMLYRTADRRQWARVTAGVHEIELDGALGSIDSFSLSFSLVPHTVEVTAPGWDVAGVIDGRLPAGGIELVRQRTQAQGGDEEIAATVFPPYLRISRNISFDLEWIVRTEVERIAPAEGAFTLGVDLLPGESVLTPGVEVEDGQAVAAFTAGQQIFTWESRLPLADTLTLSAPLERPWSEAWVFNVSPIWHAEFDGFPASPGGRSGSFEPQFFPRPGESLAVTLSRPAAATGDTIAIDWASYDRDIGERSSESALWFDYRSTQGGDHTIVLPPGSELESVMIDGDVIPVELDGDRLTLQKSPGEHEVEIEWRDTGGVGFVSTLPQADLGGGASNLYSEIYLPQDRWILFAYGPTLGPAILYWAELVVFVLAALILGRIAMSPLKSWEWLLLGLGLSTFAWPVLLLFGVWAFAMSWRERTKLSIGRLWFNGLQVTLAVLTIVTVVALVTSIPEGLLGAPNMQISSPVRSGGPLSWFSDRSEGLTDRIGVVSVSLWYYKAAMLAWALWLSFALLRWMRWAWTAYSTDGFWRGRVAQS